MSDGALSIHWVDREVPLPAAAVVARGEVARALARRLLGGEDAALARLRGVAAPGLLVLLGEADALPWVDGVSYLGRDGAAPALLLPSNRAPTVPVALLERALLERANSSAAPLAVLVEPPALVPTGTARAVARGQLQSWLDAEARG